jgi:uncharacterized repeat protein (TIGR02543 family)
MPNEPTKIGYVFGGWYTSRNGGGTQLTYSTLVTSSGTVYAKWTASSGFTVTFDADGGTPATQTKMVASGGSVGFSSMPNEPTKNGYVFDGWYTSRNGGGTQFTYSTTVTNARTVYAKWTASGSGSGISDITYSNAWTLLSDGWRQSPLISHGRLIKERVSFTSTIANVSITIDLEVSSEQGFDHAFISTLDNPNATATSGFYSGSLISGERSITVTIPVPRAGSHFIEIGYSKDGMGGSSGGDCAWFRVVQ